MSAPRGLRSKTTLTPGLRPGLHSVAAPRLNARRGFHVCSLATLDEARAPAMNRHADCECAVFVGDQVLSPPETGKEKKNNIANTTTTKNPKLAIIRKIG